MSYGMASVLCKRNTNKTAAASVVQSARYSRFISASIFPATRTDMTHKSHTRVVPSNRRKPHGEPIQLVTASVGTRASSVATVKGKDSTCEFHDVTDISVTLCSISGMFHQASALRRQAQFVRDLSRRNIRRL
ncbi:hypothetical protein RvY_04771 [Ramazzottius varieornatus]|uniref:Uncharacterized protein n=1 Tax=Ramazzottius varieornatus TaxID=947166 RepID=A0A1D1USR3_RAMVA|nr:hypothetical protein RvY_04771 [Ramazzottius varieornatus]